MREIVFDTETTGLDPFQGDRVVEIGCVELINHVPIWYMECNMEPEAALLSYKAMSEGVT